jgi:DNA polymerase-3 subunit alpha
MGAVKGVGRGAVETIIEFRNEGKYSSIFDLTQRIDLRAANKKALENLTLAGGLDSLGSTHRAQYFNPDGDGVTFLEKAIRYGAKYQESLNSSQTNLFGEDSASQVEEIKIPPCDTWGTLEQLKQEKEVVGIYLSAHPLDDFHHEMKYFSSASINLLNDLDPLINRELSFGGIVNSVDHRVSKNGKGWAIFQLEDFDDQYEFKIFGEEYLKYRHFLIQNGFIRLKVKIVEGWRNRETGKVGPPRMQFISFEMLHDTLKNNVKRLTIQLELERLNELKIREISDLIRSFKGDKTLMVDVFHTQEQIKLTLPSRKQKVDVTSELLVALEEHAVAFKLN